LTEKATIGEIVQGIREMLIDTENSLAGEERIAQIIGQQYISLVQQGYSNKEAEEILEKAADGTAAPYIVRRCIAMTRLRDENPEILANISKMSDIERHLCNLERSLRSRHSLTPLRLGIAGLDEYIRGGIGPGEVLHIVSTEGGLKTATLLQSVCCYINEPNSGKALYLSLDMNAEVIMRRLFQRETNTGKEEANYHIKNNTDLYRRVRPLILEQQAKFRVIDENMTAAKMKAVILASRADVVAIDYVTNVETGDSRRDSELDRARAVTEVVREMKKDWGITFLLLSQMSRASTKDFLAGGGGGHAKGGSTLEQLVDVEIEQHKMDGTTTNAPKRWFARIRKNRGDMERIFEIYPVFPGQTFLDRADPATMDKAQKEKYKFTLEI